jgi:transposase, IS5 family
MPTRSTLHGPHTSSVVQMLTDSVATNPVRTRAVGRLEPCAGKLACTVLRGGHAGNGVLLPDGKAHKRYEFGVKVGVVACLKKPFILAAHALPGRPYDGHTLMRSLAHATLNTGVKIKTAVADKGYRGHEAWPGARIVLPGQRSGTPAERRWRRTRLRRRSVIEALIGHMKVDGLMGRNWLKGTAGDAMHAILCAAGQNLRLLLRAIAAFLRLNVQTVLAWLRSLCWSWVDLLLGPSLERLRHAT